MLMSFSFELPTTFPENEKRKRIRMALSHSPFPSRSAEARSIRSIKGYAETNPRRGKEIVERLRKTMTMILSFECVAVLSHMGRSSIIMVWACVCFVCAFDARTLCFIGSGGGGQQSSPEMDRSNNH